MSQIVFLLLLIAMFMLGIPVMVSLGLTSVVMMFAKGGVKWATIIQQMIGGLNTFTLLAVPMFLLAGKLMNSSGTTDRLFDFAKKLVGWLPGGLAHVIIVSRIIFAGMSGTAVSDASGLGVIEIRAMNKAGFDKEFSASVTAASSTVGPIIPPSLPLVVYGTISGASVGALFMAGILPGILMAIIMMAVAFIFAIVKHYPKEKFPCLSEIAAALKEGVLPLMAPVIILVGIYTGVYTPTESAAIVVFYSLFLGIVIYKELSLKDLYAILVDSVMDASTIGILVAAATLFGMCIVRALIPQTILGIVTQSVTNRTQLLIIVNIFLLVVGMFMETTSAITILTPILMPLLIAFDVNLVQFGIIMVLNLMIGVLSPPFGLVLFVTSKIGEVPVQRMAKALLPWIAALLIALAFITFIPEISLYIPRSMGLSIG